MNLKFIYAMALGAITTLTSSIAVADLNMGVFPRRPIGVTVKSYKPLAEKLSKELGEPVKLIVPKNFKAFWKGVQSGKFDIVHYNQYHYLLSHKKKGYKVIAINEEMGTGKISGTLTVRKDSGIKSVKDLKGKTVLFAGGKLAFISYVANTAVLKKAGLEAGKDYTARFAKNPPSTAIAVFNKAADAGGAGDIILKVKGVKKKIDVTQLTNISHSEKFVHLTWAVKGDMAKDKTSKIQKIMTSLKKSDPAILKAAKVTNFLIATDKDFNPVRKTVKYVTGKSL